MHAAEDKAANGATGRHLLICLAATLLIGCGGGLEDPARTTGAPATGVSGLRARALAVSTTTGVATPAVADQLLNFAEQAFAQYFPGHKTTQSFAPFLFRFYPETGIYVGVVVSADPNYLLDGVYVMGGEFGSSPRHVGPLTAFITPDPGSAGANNGCYDLSLLETEGTHLVVVYENAGSEPGTVTEDTVVGGLTTFEGRQVREAVTTTTGTARGVTVRDTTTFFSRVTGSAETTEYGNASIQTGVLGAVTATITTRSVWSPPTVDRRYGLAIGESITLTFSGTTTQSTVATGMPETTDTWTDSTTSTVKYVGRETLTVPAGTYDTCKFEEKMPGNVATTWVIFGKGIEVKIVDSSGSSVDSSQASSVTLNGRRL